jgi:hypothetical protein
VTGGDTQVASLVGLHLLGEIADQLGLTSALSAVLCAARGHDRGRLFAQTAVMLAGGGECVADMAALRNQPALFGDVASGPTIWRAFHEHDDASLAAVRSARAAARARFWSATTVPDEVVLDIDAALVEVHATGKENAASHFKGGFGFHPMFCFADHSGEALSGLLRPGNATANDAADQLAVIDAAVAQLPAAHRAGHCPGDDAELVEHRLVVRADSAGAAVVHGLVARNIEFSVYARVKDVLHQAIRAVPAHAWQPAINHGGEPRHAGEVAELDIVWTAGPRARERSAGANSRSKAPNYDSGTTTAGGIRSHSPTRPATPASSNSANGSTPASRTASRRYAIPDWTECRSPASTPTAPGSRRSSQRTTYSHGSGSDVSPASSPAPNPRHFATGSSTPRHASCAAAAESSCDSPSTGPGRQTSAPPTGERRCSPDPT